MSCIRKISHELIDFSCIFLQVIERGSNISREDVGSSSDFDALLSKTRLSASTLALEVKTRSRSVERGAGSSNNKPSNNSSTSNPGKLNTTNTLSVME